MPFYAIIVNGYCIGESEMSAPPPGANVRIMGARDPSILGKQYQGNGIFTNATQAPLFWNDVALDPAYFRITPPAFLARAGADWSAMVVSSNALCIDFVSFMQARFATGSVDLKEAALATKLNGLTGASPAQPATNATFSGSGPMTNIKRDAILAGPTTEAERFVKGLRQPV